MVEKVFISPNRVRAYGNIVNMKTGDDFTLVNSELTVTTDTVNGAEMTVFQFGVEGGISIALTSSVSTCYVGDNVLLTATVLDDNTPVEAAEVTFKLGDTTLGTDETDANGVATYTYAASTAGSFTFSASYGSVSSTSVSVTVNEVAVSSVSLSSSESSISVGESVLLTANVSWNDGDHYSGEAVTFYDGNTSLGTGLTDANGVATLTASSLSVGSHSLTASAGTVTSSSVSVTVNHSYSLAFSQSSYVATGGSATLECTLLEDNVAKSGASITVTGTDSSTYTATTNSSGVASVTVTGINASTVFTATYQGATATCTVTVQTYLFYDACDTDNTNLYDTTTNYSNSTLTFDSSNSCYTMQRTSGTGMSSLWIKDLTVTDKVKITVDMKLATTSTVIIQGGPIIMNSAKNKGFLTMIEGYRVGDGEYSLGTTNSPNSHGTKIIADLKLGLDARNYWFTYELIIDGSSVELNIYNGSTLIKTGTITSSQLDSTGNIVGLLMSYGSGAKISVKNIKVEAL